ncbi:MAG TPA: class I SAM-dependent methyltransferase [Candidatus Dormibacteraeota bacterium]|nr:class I SAM-dependent methyltransferase [Candidatus Dormibacteraeota bacterium]
MGRARARRYSVSGLSLDASSAYTGNADAWAAGPGRLYDRLSEAVLDAVARPLAELRVLDVGAGTGAMSRAVRARGGSPVGVDSAPDMVARMRADGFDAVVGDIRSLPFDDAEFDGAVAAFAISHIDDPVHALREMRRVVRDGGFVVVAAFAGVAGVSSKQTVDEVAERYGWQRPAWYEHFKMELEPQTDNEAKLRELAAAAGLAVVRIVRINVDTGVDTPHDIVSSRIGMAYLSPFVGSLSDERRGAFITDAEAEVARNLVPLRPEVLVLDAAVQSAT